MCARLFPSGIKAQCDSCKDKTGSWRWTLSFFNQYQLHLSLLKPLFDWSPTSLLFIIKLFCIQFSHYSVCYKSRFMLARYQRLLFRISLCPPHYFPFTCTAVCMSHKTKRRCVIASADARSDEGGCCVYGACGQSILVSWITAIEI